MINLKKLGLSGAILLLIVLLAVPFAKSQESPPLTQSSKTATAATRAANAAVREALPFDNTTAFDDAQRGFISRPDTLTITDANGNVVWDLEQYKTYIGLDKDAPDTVNPSLWRNAQLNMLYGLFKVTDRIYQIRGYDLSNITFIEGDTGWIVFDPLISTETAKAALDYINAELGERPVVAIVYSHSHVDHYGGAGGIVSREDVQNGNVQIIASEGFVEHAVSENVIAGNAMSRRAIYMYGSLLPRNAQGGVNGGLGQTTSAGIPSLLLPTDIIEATGETRTIDGVEMVFQFTPGTEAPTEINTWFPQFNAMWMAENATHTMHNILTLRGAVVRDALKWSSFLNETIDLFGQDVEVSFQSHHWPTWGNEKIVDYWKKHRDMYKYMHDQTVRLMNMGYTGEEISEMIELPEELANFWPNRGYYGTLKHNTRAIYQRYMGWYDGNPSDLNNLPPEPAAQKYINYMGGENAVLNRARADFDNGEYRWVAEVLKHAVYANPDSVEAKNLLADTYEQLGYQAESGPWRSVYLQGAYELRNGVPTEAGLSTASPDTIRAMPPEMLFDYLSVLLDGPQASGKQIALTINFTDLDEDYGLFVENGTLNYSAKPAAEPDASITLAKSTLDEIQLGELALEDARASGAITLDGDQAAVAELLSLIDKPELWFNIVTP